MLHAPTGLLPLHNAPHDQNQLRRVISTCIMHIFTAMTILLPGMQKVAGFLGMGIALWREEQREEQTEG